MNRPFWSFRSSPRNVCDVIEPLLSVYADGMASPAEARQVDTHLPECENCRAALSWMQATRSVLTSRPVAVPPPDLHSRIALAIAASSPAPVSLRPARVFTVRTAYAAAASVTALGIALSYPLWHAPTEMAAKHPARPMVAATVPPSAVKPHAAPKTPTRPLVASNSVKPAAIRHTVVAHKTAVIPLEHTASNAVPTKLPVVPSIIVKAPVHHAPVIQKMASSDIAPAEKSNTEKHSPLPSVKTVAPKLTNTLKVAKVTKEPVHIPLNIQTPKLTPDLPPVQVASTHEAVSLKPDFGMGELRAHLRIQNATYVPIHIARQEISRGAANVMQTVGTVGSNDHTAFIPGVYTPTK